MLLILLVIFGILLEVTAIVVGVYLVLKLTAPVRPAEPIVRPTKIKTNVRQSHDSIYITGMSRETPVKHSGGDLVPYGLSDYDRELLEMFYDKDD
jgi:hypothetical protein